MDALTERADNFGALVAEAQRELHEGIVKAGLLRDAYRYPIMAHSAALGVLPAFIEEISRARQPWTYDERRAVVKEAVKELRKETTAFVREASAKRSLLTAAAALGLLLVGAGAGWWSGSRAEAERYANLPAELNVAMSNHDAALWLDMMRKNPRGAFDRCRDVPQTAGRACSVTLWTQPAQAAQ